MSRAIDLTNDISDPAQPFVMEQIEQRALRSPAYPAVKHGERQWTYSELVALVSQLAHELFVEGIRPGEVVAIHGGKSMGTIVALLGVLRIGGIILPIDEDLPLARKAIMLRESLAKYVLLTSDLTETLSEGVKHLIVDAQTLQICNHAEKNTEASQSSFLPISLNSAAYIFFTSGTTGIPKGIIGNHKGLSHFVRWEQKEFAIGPTDRVAQLTSLSFDGMLKDIFPALIGGAMVVLPTNNRPFEDPQSLLAWLDLEKITIIQTVPSVISSWLLALSHQSSLLQSVRLLCLAGEPLTGTVIENWHRNFPACSAEIVNLYGPTETTILKSFYRVPQNVSAGVQPIGYPLPDTQLLLLNRHGNLCDVSELGEIVIRTKFATLGYINASPEENARFFVNPWRNDEKDILYRTGDSGRLEPDGLITIAGRLDDQVKIRGVRIQPSEITALLSDHSSVGSCVVLPHQQNDQEVSLVAYVVLQDQQQVTAQELRDYLATYLPPAMLPGSFRFLDKMPLMANGKINREALPPPTAEISMPVAEQPTPIQELLIRIWMEVLKKEHITPHDNFFDLGGHSLLVFQVISRIRKVFEVEVDVHVCFEFPTVTHLAAHIEKSLAAAQGLRTFPAITSSPENNTPLLLSPVQQRLWFIHQLEPQDSSYHMIGTLRLKGPLRREILDACLQTLVDRHEALHTHFPTNEEGVLVALVAPSSPPPTVHHVDLSLFVEHTRYEHAIGCIQEYAGKPMNLETGPLVRVVLLKLSDEEHLFALITHHIISDGWSWGILTKELAVLWETYSHNQPSPFPPLAIQYSDYAYWQHQWLNGDVLEKLLTYWKQHLAPPLPLLELPTDFPRPSTQTYRGAHRQLDLSATLSKDVLRLASKQRVTLFMVLLAAFDVLLARLSGLEDIVIGSDSAGRKQVEIENVVGFFINTLVLRTHLAHDPSFTDLLRHIRDVVLGAYTHEDVPFEKLVEVLHPDRDLGRSPLFQVMFRMSPLTSVTWQLPSLEISSFPVYGQTAKFDLTVVVNLSQDLIAFDFEYNRDLFSEQRISRLQQQYMALLAQIVQQPQARLSSFSLLTENETEIANILAEELPEPSLPPVLELVRSTASLYPQNPALRQGASEWTYRELISAVDALAPQLFDCGLRPNHVVAIEGEKNFGTIIAILSLFSIGCVIVPLDEQLPPLRKEIMLTQSDATHLLCSVNSHHSQQMAVDQAINVLHIDAHTGCLEEHCSNDNNREEPYALPVVHSNDPAYIFFTSGTTGVPKGIVGTHKGVSHFVKWEKDAFSVGPTDCIAQLTTLSFDAVLRDIFLPLVSGATLCLPTERDTGDITSLLTWFENADISIIHTIPSMVSNWLAGGSVNGIFLKRLRLLCLAGEPLYGTLVGQWHRTFPDCGAEVVNFYGPTETTMIKSFYKLPAVPLSWVQPIGHPLPNTQIFILSSENCPCGCGELGEIVIRTPFRTHGYIDTTHELATGFFVNPFRNDLDDLLYRTGDLGRLEPDGTIRLAGRIDDQAKIRGVRVQPAEIAAILSAHSLIKACTVLVWQHSEDKEQKRLIAYVVPNEDEQVQSDELRLYLSSRLPSAMIPDHFLFIPRLPLLPNGKVDRDALLQIALPDTQQAYIAPQTSLQKKMAAIWAQALQVEQIGIHDDFFDAGGHSLLAALVVTQMRKAFDIELSLRNLLEHPTIATIEPLVAEALEENSIMSFSPLVSIQAHGERPPIFCVHPIGGSVACYKYLANALGEDQPFYGFQSYGLEGTFPLSTLESMASAYIQAMRRIQPDGLVNICGWSLGGVVAFEMARQLRENGDEIHFLGLFDSYAPKSGAYRPQEHNEQQRATFIQDMIALARYTTPTHSWEQRILQDEKELQQRLEVYNANQQAAIRYSPVKTDLRLTLFLATQQERESHVSSSLGWEELGVGTIEIIKVPGNHYSLLSPPQVAQVAEEIRKKLL